MAFENHSLAPNHGLPLTKKINLCPALGQAVWAGLGEEGSEAESPADLWDVTSVQLAQLKTIRWVRGRWAELTGLVLQEFRRKQSPLRLLGDMLSHPFLLFRERIFLEADLMFGVLYSQMNIWQSSGGIRLSFTGLANTATTRTEFFASMSGSR